MLNHRYFCNIVLFILSQANAFLQPSIDENVYLLGSFDAISLYDEVSKYNLSFTSDNLSVYKLSSKNESISLYSYDSVSKTNIPDSWQYISGNKSIAIIDGEPFIYHYNNGSIQNLVGWDNVDGSVKTIYYDDDDDIIYLGGDLSYNGTYGAISYDYLTNQFFSLPFGGFNEGSVVNEIIRYEMSDSIIFAGNFYSIGEQEYLNITGNFTRQNITTINNRNSSKITDLSQMIILNSSSVIASGGSDPDAITCPGTDSSTWSLPSGELGTWGAELSLSAIPSKIRLYNPDGDEGVSLFRIVTYPANGIMNLTYIDPDTLELTHCDAYCPLLRTSEATSLLESNANGTEYQKFFHDNQTVISISSQYQDFAFVNLINVESFTVEILGSYNNQAALNGIELFSSGITVFADNALNQKQCSNSQNNFDTSSNSIGNIEWEESNTGSYLYSNISSSTPSNEIGIRYELEIPNTGEYEVLLYTVGCLDDDTCSQRGIVNATLYNGNGDLLSSKIIYQTNQELKYDILYTGDIQYYDSLAYIDVTYNSNLTNSNVIMVASSVQFNYVQVDIEEFSKNVTHNYTQVMSTELKLNGVLEYSLRNFSIDSALVEQPIGNTSINLIGAKFDGNATINGLAVNKTALILSGDFSTEDDENILGFSIDGYNNTYGFIKIGESMMIPDIDGIVNGSFGTPEEYIMFGNLKDNTKSFGVSIFHGSNSSISQLDISGNQSLSQINGFQFNDTEYFILNYNNTAQKLYNYDNLSTFENSSTFGMNINSVLESDDSDQDSVIVMGSIVEFDMESNNIVSFENSQISSIKSNTSQLRTGVFLGTDKVAIGGDGIYLVSNNKTNALVNGLSVDGVDTMMYYKSNVFFGFNGTGNYNSKDFSSLAAFDTASDNLKTLNESITGNISCFTVDPQFGTVIIGGNFNIPGKCTSLCTLGNSTDGLYVDRTLTNATLTGTVNAINYYDEFKVLIGGDFNSNDNTGYLGVYDTYNGTIDILDISKKLSGTVKSFLFGDETKNFKSLNDTIIVLGEQYLGYFNNSKWTSLSSGMNFTNDLFFSSISLVNSSSSSFVNDKALLLTGLFELPEYGIVSSALYNGTHWTPLSITANRLDTSQAKVQNVVRMTTMFTMTGAFTQSASVTSSSSKPTATHETAESKLFTKGEVTGVSLALALGTTILIAFAVWGLYIAAGTSVEKESIDGLNQEKMLGVVPPSEFVVAGEAPDVGST